jgi:hypothetical protein
VPVVLAQRPVHEVGNVDRRVALTLDGRPVWIAGSFASTIFVTIVTPSKAKIGR